MNLLEAAVNDTLAKWAYEDALYVCRLVRKGGCTIELVEYPTGLRKVRVTAGNERAEVPYDTYCTLSSNHFTIKGTP